MTAEPSAAPRRKPKPLNEHGQSAFFSAPPVVPPARHRPGPPPAMPCNFTAPAPLATTAGRSRDADEDHHHNHHQNRSSHSHPLPPSPPRPAGGAEEDESSGRTFTTSPARPERGQEGKDKGHHADAIAAVLDNAARPHTHLNYTIYTPSEQPELPPPRGAETATGGGGEQRGHRRNLDASSRLPSRLSLL